MTYTETDLIIPVLRLLADAGPTGLTTTHIKDTLLQELELSEADLKILAGRNDTHFSQQVRNLVSHKTLERKQLASFEPGEPSGRFTITQQGSQYLAQHAGEYEYLVDSGFTEAERKAVIDTDYKDLVIEEGHFIPASQALKRKRSRQLTNIARKHFAVNGTLRCAGCNFCFNDFYGETAKNYIEIHHLQPIHTYGADDIERSLQQALDNVSPLCANCHRMAHRDSRHLLNVAELKQLVANHGNFEPIKGN